MRYEPHTSLNHRGRRADDRFGLIDDGFGSVAFLCRPGCKIHVVRPGKFRCYAPDCSDEEGAA